MYLLNLQSDQFHLFPDLFPTINTLKCWRPRGKIGLLDLDQLKLEFPEPSRTLLFCYELCYFRRHKFVGVSNDADIYKAKNRTSEDCERASKDSKKKKEKQEAP